ncbi:ROK family protein [Wenyingzhuangia aestuarii]|uniref:ROK family protein n=1 Tax=Wenyingzhuangia aestuarii TaxID=1647582 RepID=UPI001439D7C5|nr:ROK family protein [Wenyingzhuangia aestuarii]NJB82277.1 glucokinase [Wenyingzhuangia aestuarii]
MTEEYLGIDVGGTNIKFGIVSQKGELLSKTKHPTLNLRETNDFITAFVKKIGHQLKEYPHIKKVGIAVPGLISKDRRSTVFMANIPEFNNIALITILEEKYPNITFFLDNDANAAAIGELHFSKSKAVPADFIFMTLGTGLGSAAVLDGEIFKGGNGNAMEAGHIITSNGKTAEENMGKKAIVEMALSKIKKGKETSLKVKDLDSKAVVLACTKADPVAIEVFEKVGTILGEALVSTIRILDIETVFIGGGVSKSFSIVRKNMHKELKKRLPHYYINKLDIRLATLGNDAGILGAAALCFKA